MKKALLTFLAILLFAVPALAQEFVGPLFLPDRLGTACPGGVCAAPLDLGDFRLYSSTACLNLGGAYVPVSGGVTGSVCVGKDVGGVSMEVEGLSYFKAAAIFSGAVTLASTTTVNNNVSLIFGALGATGSGFRHRTATFAQATYGVGTDYLRTLFIMESADTGVDVGTAFGLQVNPTLVLQSSDVTSPLQRIYWTHDQTNGVITTDAGGIDLQPANGVLKTNVWTVDYVLRAGAQNLGPTAPSFDTNDSCVGLEFDADAERVSLLFEIPSCWDGASDLVLKAYWCAESGDAPADTETVKWDAEWRSIVWGTEDVDNGTLATGTVTYTQSGAGDDKDSQDDEITIPYTGGNQPLAVGDILSIQFDRDVGGDTYSGGAIIPNWEMSVDQTQLKCDHQN